MRFLTRPAPPKCLLIKDYRIHRFEKLSTGQKTKIWKELKLMQGEFCAYCEKSIGKRNRQIEHFYPKNVSPDGITSYRHLTFDWTNLFGACVSSDHCGQFKDMEGEITPKPYSPDNLIKPDHHDPKLYFMFTLLGEIILRDDLETNFDFRANETVRVFNLNTPSLLDSRLSLIESFNLRLTTILELGKTINSEKFGDEISRLKQDITKSEYRTAIESALFS